MEVRINLNESVKFKLSERGKDIYRHRYDGYGFEYDSIREPKLDDEGYVSMQLWMFMQTFGEHMIMGMPEVLKPLEIIYEESEPITPKPIMTEEVREALMRLSMCAREECSICKYENDCGFDKQVEMATESMNTILKAFKEPPTERTGEWIPVSEPPKDGRNVFLAHGTNNFKSCCIGHYDHSMEICVVWQPSSMRRSTLKSSEKDMLMNTLLESLDGLNLTPRSLMNSRLQN